MKLDIEPGVSLVLVLLGLAAAMTALVGLFLTGLTLPLTLAFALAILVSTWHQIRWLLGLESNSIRRVQFERDIWWLTLGSGRMVTAELAGPVVVLPKLVSIHFRVGHRRLTWVVAADSVSATEHRRLRATLLLMNLENSRLSVARWYQNCIAWIRG